MKFGLRKRGIVLFFLAAILLSACADGATGDVLIGVLSKSGGDQVLMGTLDRISEIAWTVSGRTVKISDDTRVDTDLHIGDSVRVEVSLGDDGFMNALQIEPSSRDMFVVGAEIEFFGVVEEIHPTGWLIGGFEVTVTPDTEVKADIVVGDLVKVHAVVGEGDKLTAREIELADPDDKNDELDRDEVEFVGTVEAISDGMWIVDGRVILVTSQTEIEGETEVGDIVKVEAFENEDGVLVAHEIEQADDDIDNELDDDDVDDELDDDDLDDDKDDDEDHDEDDHDDDDDEDENDDDEEDDHDEYDHD